MRLFSTLLLWSCLCSVPLFAKQELIHESFDSQGIKWRDIYLEGVKEGGSYSIKNGKLTLKASQTNSVYGICFPKPVSGHFFAQVEYDRDENCGLALIQAKDGVPDPENFTSIHVTTNGVGKVVVQVRDRQHGKDNVFDHSGKLGPERYEIVLDNQYSVPFDRTNKKIRVFHDGPAGFFRFYYAVKRKIRDKWAEGWMELAPSKDWAEPGQKYYVVLYAHSGEDESVQVSFDNLCVLQKPTKDRSDVHTGFKAIRREYNWSGFFGDAVVISFGEDFAYRAQDRKFVFWSEMNYVPAWHMNDQLLYSYEFLETWGGGSKGCFEPMSDRLRRWSKVEILEDNAVRKIVHWHYVLCDPDYKVPDDNIGRQLPEADEYWTFYPDGTGFRHIVYTPKLDSQHRKWHELTELIMIAGSLTNPVDHAASPALTVLNLEGDANEYHRGSARAIDRRTGKGEGFRSVPEAEVNQWNQVIMDAHFTNAPDAFIAFSHAQDTPETYSHYRMLFEVSWHGTRYQMSHWPVGLEPYQRGFQSRGTWTSQVTHTSLMGGGIHDGIDWNDHYKIDQRGRKYRQWVALVGLSEPGNLEGLRARTAGWLYPGTVKMLGSDSRFSEINYKRGEIVFCNRGETRQCFFTLTPGKHGILVNPVLKIENWGLEHSLTLKINGKVPASGKDYKVAYESDAAVIWVKGKFDSPATFHIRERL